MDRDVILATLRAHQQELKAAGLLHLRLFGSVARGDQGPHSDVDLIADYDGSRTITLLTLSGLRNDLTDLLGSEVHLSSNDTLYPHIRERMLAEAVLAF